MTQLPSPIEFFLETPLYASFEIDRQNYRDVLSIEFFQESLDAFCVSCSRDSVFKSMAQLPDIGQVVQLRKPINLEDFLTSNRAYFSTSDGSHVLGHLTLVEYALRDKIFSISFQCSRDTDHHLLFICKVVGNIIVKIGQFPSLADLQSANLKKYRKILGEEKYREFTRAVGLNAHGIGIGAFVYLRRIFENLIDEAHQEAVKDRDWDEDAYHKGRVIEKIFALQNHLPQFLVENREIYGILSKGIHSLSEQDCLGYFTSVKLGIELILDEKMEKQKKQEKASLVSRSIAAIKGKLQ